MKALNIDFSFRKNISSINKRSSSEYSCSLPKEFTTSTNELSHTGTSFNTSGLSLNNTSRFEEKKALRKLKEQDVLNRMYFCYNLVSQN